MSVFTDFKRATKQAFNVLNIQL